MEQTLVVVKPDGVMRGLTGEIVKRFEQVGLKIVASKMLQVTAEHAEKHYPADRSALWKGIGGKTLENYKEMGVDAKKELGTDDAEEIGNMVRVWLHKYITEGPVFAFVMEGPHAVELVRRIVGHTLPLKAASGTIRGDYSFDSSFLANTAKRPIRNLIHASGDLEEAKYEVDLWFNADEIVSYKRVEEAAML
ncbi:nucleoside-diphosphate kinase [Candidatus Woesebacteria bacterium]|jgi:nucleoside-diphosphate kinase|nr:nucleoside-diphosphate kinase [Candidatus Woesebacteria bacterium]